MVKNVIGIACYGPGTGAGRGHGNCHIIDDKIAPNLHNVLFANYFAYRSYGNILSNANGAITQFHAKEESAVWSGVVIMGDSPIAVEEIIIRDWDNYWEYAEKLEISGDRWPRLHLA